MSDRLIIMGASRLGGNTSKSIDLLLDGCVADIADLHALEISPYDYQHKNRDDDFLKLSQQMIAAKQIIFATPVYWYSMSAPMKIFFDRLTDLMSIRKKDGRALAGKQTYLFANGTESELPEGFEVPFRRTSEYFDMDYRGAAYVVFDRDRHAVNADQVVADLQKQILDDAA